jgi:RNA polymerase sigma-70 factor (ECF subfamily)
MALGRRVREAPEEADQQLVRAAVAGDLAAFDRLVERHCRKVACVAGQLLNNPHDVEDVVQETFLRAFEHLAGFRGEASVRTWLIRIAMNLCRNRRQTFWWRRVLLTADHAAFEPSPADARALAEEALAQRELQHALERLPERLRLPLVLHFFEELSGAEIAAILGCSENAVWKRIYAGRRALRKSLPAFGLGTEE